ITITYLYISQFGSLLFVSCLYTDKQCLSFNTGNAWQGGGRDYSSDHKSRSKPLGCRSKSSGRRSTIASSRLKTPRRRSNCLRPFFTFSLVLQPCPVT